MSNAKLLLLILVAYAPISWSQCAPGIPGAGNPGCIPPSAPGSPYGQPDSAGPLPPSVPAPVWEDRWGAIAIDYTNGAAGGANKEATKSGATQLAVERCMHSGGTHCEVTVSFVNQCAAIAQKAGRGLVYPATAANSEADEAARRAITKCGDSSECKVVASLCSYAVRVQ
jgi:hypothetical protein